MHGQIFYRNRGGTHANSGELRIEFDGPDRVTLSNGGIYLLVLGGVELGIRFPRRFNRGPRTGGSGFGSGSLSGTPRRISCAQLVRLRSISARRVGRCRTFPALGAGHHEIHHNDGHDKQNNHQKLHTLDPSFASGTRTFRPVY